MNKKIKVIITVAICIIIIGIGAFIIFKDSGSGNKESREFIKAIENIQDEKYVDAYNKVKNGNTNEKNIVQTIFLHKFSNQIDTVLEITEEISDEFENITDYLTYTYLYSKDSKYQANIDRIYVEKYPALYDFKNKMPKEIMFDDTNEMYDTYFEYVEKSDGLFKDSENKLINSNSNFSSDVETISGILTKFDDEYKEVSGKHPLSSIPEEYIILLDLNDED